MGHAAVVGAVGADVARDAAHVAVAAVGTHVAVAVAVAGDVAGAGAAGAVGVAENHRFRLVPIAMQTTSFSSFSGVVAMTLCSAQQYQHVASSPMDEDIRIWKECGRLIYLYASRIPLDEQETEMRSELCFRTLGRTYRVISDQNES